MDISEIKELTELFASLDIQSMKLSKGDFSVEMKKESGGMIYYGDEALPVPSDVQVAPQRMAAPRAVAASAAPAPVAAPAEEAAAPLSPAVELRSIKSPLVGTFYSAPSPDRPPFVSVGTQVKKGQVVCIVEAMKVMNEIHADADGEIAEVCHADGALVEFGTPLFKLR